MNDAFIDNLHNYQQRIQQFLEHQLATLADTATEQYAPNLLAAMHYAVLNGGKRIRPLLVYATAQALKADQQAWRALDFSAAAVECIHCYSLVHDDLPAMDDDDLRRGNPTCHKKFDEATAILVGDALQTEAFHLLLRSCDDAELRIQLLQTLVEAASARGLIGGQAIDLAATQKTVDLKQLQTMHQLKTGALIRCSVTLAAIVSRATEQQRTALDNYANAIGLAFQIQDDILDVESSTQVLGKNQGSDIAKHKSTYPSLLGLDAAKALLQQLLDQALAALAIFDNSAVFLRELALFIVKRKF